MSNYSIQNNLETARQIIDKSSRISGVRDITLVGVTKNRSPEEIADLITAGCADIGENRVQEWEDKLPYVMQVLQKKGWNGKFTSHLVGILQSNKARKAVNHFNFIQSLDSVKLADRINRIAIEENLESVPCLIQVKLGDEESKSGLEKNLLLSSFEAFANLEKVTIQGFMLIAPLWAIGEAARPYYNDMFEIFNYFKSQKDSRFSMKYLSMGMSADFDVAIEEGANMVRIGRALFDGFDRI